jgi:hypothetical protein
MKVRVHYRGGEVFDFVVDEEILVADFAVMARQHGAIRKVEFL